MLRNAMIWICGLNTTLDSDWCGIRPMLLQLAAKVGADLIGATWDGQGMSWLAGDTLTVVKSSKSYDTIVAGGHSHGAWRLYDMLRYQDPDAVAAAGFLDICPPYEPTAWLTRTFDRPKAASKALCIYQRNDIPLAGVLMTADPQTTQINATPWGLHHATLPSDSRVQDRLSLLMLEAFTSAAHAQMGASS